MARCTAAERALLDRLAPLPYVQAPPVELAREDVDAAARAVFDCTGGAIPWGARRTRGNDRIVVSCQAVAYAALAAVAARC